MPETPDSYSQNSPGLTQSSTVIKLPEDGLNLDKYRESEEARKLVAWVQSEWTKAKNCSFSKNSCNGFTTCQCFMGITGLSRHAVTFLTVTKTSCLHLGSLTTTNVKLLTVLGLMFVGKCQKCCRLFQRRKLSPHRLKMMTSVLRLPLNKPGHQLVSLKSCVSTCPVQRGGPLLPATDS